MSPEPAAPPEGVLREEILTDAERQRERTIRKAKKDADDMMAAARVDADKDRAARLEAARAEGQRRRDLVLATVPVEITRRHAERTEELLRAIHDEALRRLSAREGLDVRRALVALAAEAVTRMEGNRFIVELSEADRRACGDGLGEAIRARAGRPEIAIEITAVPGESAQAGLVVRDPEGRQVWDNRLVARLERLWPALRHGIAARTGLLDMAEGRKEPS